MEFEISATWHGRPARGTHGRDGHATLDAASSRCLNVKWNVYIAYQQLFHFGMMCVLHGDGFDLKTVFSRQFTDIRTIVVTH